MVKLSYRHLLVLLIVLSVFEDVFKHILLVAAIHSLLEILFFLHAFFFLRGVKFVLFLELFKLRLFITGRLGFDFFNLSAFLHHGDEGSSSLLSP
jgi:hypothetical protein